MRKSPLSNFDQSLVYWQITKLNCDVLHQLPWPRFQKVLKRGGRPEGHQCLPKSPAKLESNYILQLGYVSYFVSFGQVVRGRRRSFLPTPELLELTIAILSLNSHRILSTIVTGRRAFIQKYSLDAHLQMKKAILSPDVILF